MTVDLGMGANMGIESAVSLANALHRAVTQQSSNDPLTTAALSSLFEQYQSERYPRAKQFVHLSSGITRMRSYETWWKKIVISRISTLPFVDRVQGKDFIALLAKGPKLEYAKTRTINDNAAGWKVMEEEGTGKAAWVVYGIVTSVVAVGVTYLAATKWGVRS
jgi:FAD dependent monooxygenase